jgi:hypothetical protein
MQNSNPMAIKSYSDKEEGMKIVTRQEFTEYLHKEGKNLLSIPTESIHRCSMWYINEQNKVMAKAEYSKPINMPGISVVVTYYIRED